MDKEKKKKLNGAISIIREECRKHKDCSLCPLERWCCGVIGMPRNWADIGSLEEQYGRF